MFGALLIYLASLAVLLACALSFYRQRRLGGLAACALLTVQVFVRPVMFFIGLDVPAPPEVFGGQRWDLVGLTSAMAAIWIAILSFSYWVFDQNAPARGFLPAAPMRARINDVVMITVALTVLSGLATGYLVSQAGSIGRFIIMIKVEKALAGSYIIREISTLANCVAAFGVISAGKLANPARVRYLTIFLVLFALNFAFNFLWGNRYNIAVLAFAVIVAWHFSVRHLNVRRFAVVGGILLAALFALRRIRTSTSEQQLQALEFWRELSYSLHFGQFDGLMLAFRDAGERFDFRWGQDFLNGLIAFVPRFIYEAKETYMIGGWFRQIYQPDTVNGWPVTVIGDWYINFSWPGIVLGAMLSGIFIAILDKAYSKVAISAWSAGVGSVLAFTLFDGGFGFGTIQRYVVLAIPMFFISWLLNWRAQALHQQSRNWQIARTL